VLLVRLGVGVVYRRECKRSLGRNSVFGMNQSGACRGPARQLRHRISKKRGSLQAEDLGRLHG
jgi:hypothetical protein